mmetsp:Transcript_4553/g.14950  ORF Transcript_4553/g.14950 Transcript_4553/m.14950 type:complete len:289 (+) Transcript_4553:658-1524(+)
MLGGHATVHQLADDVVGVHLDAEGRAGGQPRHPHLDCLALLPLDQSHLERVRLPSYLERLRSSAGRWERRPIHLVHHVAHAETGGLGGPTARHLEHLVPARQLEPEPAGRGALQTHRVQLVRRRGLAAVAAPAAKRHAIAAGSCLELREEGARAAVTAATKGIAASEELLEDLPRVDVHRVRRPMCAAGTTGARAALDAVLAKLVVHLALLVVGKHSVGFGNLSKLCLRLLLVVGVLVGVPLQCQLPISLFDFFRVGRPRDTETLVVVAPALGRRGTCRPAGGKRWLC